MNIRWDNSAREFVAEFDDFRADLEAAKAAGFRTNGPPEWRWYAPAPGVKALNRLRENRPAVLTITPEALEIYKPLAELEIRNEEVKKQLAGIKKKQKKELKESTKCDWLPPGKEFLGVEDLPPAPPFIPSYLPSKIQPIGVCRVCNDPTYGWPDLGDICLWCEHQIVENNA